MQFVFNGTLEDFKESIKKRAKIFHKDIVIYQDTPDILQIGFLRLGYNGGRFFIANVTEKNGCITLKGEIKNQSTPIPNNDTRNLFQKIRDTLLGFIFLYVFLALIPWIIWAVFDIPHPWISFLIPVVIILLFYIISFFSKEERNFDNEDEKFIQFLSMICGEITIPTTSQELYNMLISADGLHSVPKLNNDVLTWELYNNATVKASISETDTMIDIVYKNNSYMHWHPNIEDMYEILCNLGKRGNILVLHKSFLGVKIYYSGNPDKYSFGKYKTWHWGKLLYLEQK